MLAIIPAKKNSKRLPNKNIKSFHGKPLIWYSIREAKKSKKISNLLVSTDSYKIAKLSKKFGANVPFLRPKKFSKSNSTLLDVCKHTLKFIEDKNNKKYSSVIVLQPTSPLRLYKDIDNAIKIFNKTKADVLASFSEAKPIEWHRKLSKIGQFKNYLTRKNSNYQKMKKNYLLNGSIYIFSRDFIKAKKKKFKFFSYIMPKERSVDIDTIEDLEYASYLYKKLKLKN
jgi:N-acylneuraminate cytidylyltransferase/CMP-N,N'-diacetyllegionaminic acid synthase